MKRILIIIISFFLMPVIVNAETLTYEICKSGCEYSSIRQIREAINNIDDLQDKEIIIKVVDDYSEYGGVLSVGSENNRIKSLTIDGNIDLSESTFYADSLTLKNLRNGIAGVYEPRDVNIINS